MSDDRPEIPGFGPVERDDEGHLTTEHQESGWTIKASDEQVLRRMADLVHRSARLRRERDHP